MPPHALNHGVEYQLTGRVAIRRQTFDEFLPGLWLEIRILYRLAIQGHDPGPKKCSRFAVRLPLRLIRRRLVMRKQGCHPVGSDFWEMLVLKKSGKAILDRALVGQACQSRCYLN